MWSSPPRMQSRRTIFFVGTICFWRTNLTCLSVKSPIYLAHYQGVLHRLGKKTHEHHTGDLVWESGPRKCPNSFGFRSRSNLPTQFNQFNEKLDIIQSSRATSTYVVRKNSWTTNSLKLQEAKTGRNTSRPAYPHGVWSDPAGESTWVGADACP